MVLSKTMMTIRGINIGKVNFRKVDHEEAPSTLAASKASFGNPLKPESKTKIEKGAHCQMDINVMVYKAIFGDHHITLENPILQKN